MTQTKLISALRPIGILGLVRESELSVPSATDKSKEPAMELAIYGRVSIERQVCIDLT